MAKKNKKTAAVPTQTMGPAVSMSGIGPAPMNSVMGPAVSVPVKRDKRTRQQSVSMTQEQMMNLSPEQVTQLQLEEAIKENQNPGMRLKKLRSPFSVRNCLLNILFLVVLTLVVVFILVWLLPLIKVDKFDFGVLWIDLFEKTGIAGLFRRIGEFFSSCGSDAAEAFRF